MLASLIFSSMNLIVKQLDDIPVAQIVFMRSIVMLIMVAAIVMTIAATIMSITMLRIKTI